MEQLIKSVDYDELIKCLYKYIVDLKFYSDYTKKILGYQINAVIRKDIDILDIVKVGTWIARPLDLSWFDYLLRGAIEHHGLVTAIDNTGITITHFHGPDKKNSIVKKNTFIEFLTDMFDDKFNVYYPENIEDSVFEYIHHLNPLSKALEIAESLIGNQDYNFFTNNCEKFVSDCVFKTSPHSLQTNRFLQFINQLMLDTSLGNTTDRKKVCMRIYDTTYMPVRKFKYNRKTGKIDEYKTSQTQTLTL